MLYFYFRPERETLDIIAVWLGVMPYIVIEHVTECHYWSCSIKSLIMAKLNKFHLVTWPNQFQSFELI